jgi:hypothetical protein
MAAHGEAAAALLARIAEVKDRSERKIEGHRRKSKSALEEVRDQALRGSGGIWATHDGARIRVAARRTEGAVVKDKHIVAVGLVRDSNLFCSQDV